MLTERSVSRSARWRRLSDMTRNGNRFQGGSSGPPPAWRAQRGRSDPRCVDRHQFLAGDRTAVENAAATIRVISACLVAGSLLFAASDGQATPSAGPQE